MNSSFPSLLAKGSVTLENPMAQKMSSYQLLKINFSHYGYLLCEFSLYLDGEMHLFQAEPQKERKGRI